ncbi:MAG TPA: L-seryl-tRNA(Sec) selenium transferase [Gemmatimonadaceae bacterium]|nr:L-seryl-tRNA(Sec) selenium transferase [Gemmatimonadaceae bacterium]
MTDARRSLPAVHTLLADPALAPLLARAPRPRVTNAVRDAIERVRSGGIEAPESAGGWAALAESALDGAEDALLRRVINATGIVLHTNLGRAPLASPAIDAMVAIAGGHANLEFDLATGMRGSRLTHTRALLMELTGAEDALVVNNCAAALVLALRALADGRDVLVSRGELIEIGGSFRVPDIMTQAGVRLVEIGTTNRTHLDDYRRALGAPTGAIVKVHRSNFTMDGFVAEVGLRDLATVANEAGVPLIHDFGSGLLLDLAAWGLAGEPTARDALASGARVVVMSGDKLLGGPQAGIVLGDARSLAAMRAHPLARALRVDKLTLAALQATLLAYREPAKAVREIPTLAMITATPEAVRARAEALGAELAALEIPNDIVPAHSAVGGGAYPTARLDSFAIRLYGDAARWERALRSAPVPVIGRVQSDAMRLDIRTVLPADQRVLIDMIARSTS